MTEQKHTPGPWRYSYCEPLSKEIDEDLEHECIVYKDRLVMVAMDASLYSASLKFKTEADRALLISAPELLEALEGVIESPHVRGSLHRDRLKMAEKAIAKAKGEN